MSRAKIIEEFTNLLALSLRHKIGSMVNKDDVYSKKYADESQVLLNNAKKSIFGITFNFYEKREINNILRRKLLKELESKTFLNNKKFEMMDEEINKVLNDFKLT